MLRLSKHSEPSFSNLLMTPQPASFRLLPETLEET
jgi:hypothetical protein